MTVIELTADDEAKVEEFAGSLVMACLAKSPEGRTLAFCCVAKASMRSMLT